MSEPEAIQFYIATIIDTARRMPVGETVNFLRGALAMAGHHEAADPLREAYQHLVAADAQLELIAGAQRKLDLDGKDGQ